MNKRKKKGGGIFDIFSSTKNNIDEAINSEIDFLDKYNKYLKAKKDFNIIHEKHLTNLLTLDDYNKIGDSLVTIFKEKIFNDKIEENNIKIDENIPLLLQNYLINSETKPYEFRRQHLISQVNYVLFNYHPNDNIYFENVNVILKNNDAIIQFSVTDNRYFTKTVSIDKNYILNEDEIEESINDILDDIKTLKKNNNSTSNKYLLKNKEVITPTGTSNKITNKTINNLLSKTNKKRNKLNKSLKENNKINSYTKKEYIPVKKNNKNTKKNNKNIVSLLEPNNKKENNKEKSLSKKQRLLLQYRQALPVKGENNKGRTVFGIDNINNTIRGDILGQNINKPTVKLKYNNMSKEELKKMNISKLDKSEIEKICNRFSDDEEECKKIKECWYNPNTEPKCYRFRTRNEK